MQFPKLFKYTNSGKIQEWQIICPPDENYYYTIEGIVDGKLTTSDPTYCTGKNKGKSNETTDEGQALLEAQSKFQKKLDKGYNEVLTKDKKYFEPMLAFELKQYEKLLFTKPTFIQPKLDGVRCILNNGKLSTRAGKDIVSCPHLEHKFFGLDGELYSNSLKEDFNKIISLTRKSKPDQSDILESASLIQYWIYDYPYMKDKVFSERYAALKHDFKNFPESFKLVPTYQINTREELEAYHIKFLEEGYEGSIIRMDLGEYENKRSKQLLKYKNWMDEEFDIIEVLEGKGNRAGCANMLSVKLPNSVICNATMTGTEEYMREVLKNKNSIIGKQATVKYFGYTVDGNLRFPTVKNIINYI